MIDRRRLERLEARRRAASPPSAATSEIRVPHITEFAMSSQFLNIPLFPRQVTLLKMMFCDEQMMTAFDREVIEGWAAGFQVERGNDGTVAYRGQYGTPDDVWDRMRWCRSNGRKWFREVTFVGGRRGSKSLLGAIAAAYVIWNLLALGDPARYFGIVAGKQLQVPVFAGQRDQARANQWKDLHDLITGSECFEPFIAKVTTDTNWLYSPAQRDAGNVPAADAALVITAKQATPLAGRGPATPVQLYDEMAHMVASGANRSAQEVFSAAHPALAQFNTSSFLYEASSPWTKQGQFHTNYLNGLAVDPDTGAALSPDTLVVQLTSFELYKDWENTTDPKFVAWPGGPTFTAREAPLLNESAERALRRSGPEGYDVEYLAQWATSLSAYLPPEYVDSLFAPWKGEQLQMPTRGVIGHRYFAHADPSSSNANFAVVIAHPERDEADTRHVVVDYAHAWRPRDFDGGHIDYEYIAQQLKDLLIRFPIQQFSYDQFESAGALWDPLRSFARDDPRVIGHPQFVLRRASASSNRRMTETTKTALGRNLVHAPYHQLLDDELRHLQITNGRVGHPTSGPVKTDDLADALMNVVDHLLSDDNAYDVGNALAATMISASQPHPLSEKFSAVHQRTPPNAAPRGYFPDAARGTRFGRRGYR